MEDFAAVNFDTNGVMVEKFANLQESLTNSNVSELKNMIKQQQGNLDALTDKIKGKDQELRVTPNFSDGDNLRELSQLKMELEALERKVHASEVTGEGSVTSIQKQVDGLRQKVENLSNLLTPNQEEDVT